MSVSTFTVVDYVVLIALLSTSTFIGFYFAWKDRKQLETSVFLTANKRLGWKPVSLSMTASFLSAIAILGFPSEVFQYGGLSVWGIAGTAVGVLLGLFVFLPMYYEMNITSVNELVYMGVVLYGPSLTLGSVTGIPVWISIIVNGLVCTLYTAIGGIKAVVWSDVLQMLLMIAGYLLVLIAGSIQVGGFAEVWRIADHGGRTIFNKLTTNPYEIYTTYNVFTSWMVHYMMIYCASQTQVQRYMSMGSLSEARKAILCTIPGISLVICLSVLCGFVLYAVYGDCNPMLTSNHIKSDQMMPYFVQDFLRNYPGLGGFFAAAVFSGSLSTLSSGYNALAAITWHDFVEPRVDWTQRRALKFTKCFAAFFGFTSIGMAFFANHIPSVIQAINVMVGALNGPLLSVFMSAMFLPFVKARGAICGLVGGATVSLWLAFGSISYTRAPNALPSSTLACALNGSEPVFFGSFDEASIPKGILAFYHVSYMWMMLFSFTVSMGFAIIGSLIFDRSDQRKTDSKYIAPFIRRFVEDFAANEVSNLDEKRNCLQDTEPEQTRC